MTKNKKENQTNKKIDLNGEITMREKERERVYFIINNGTMLLNLS